MWTSVMSKWDLCFLGFVQIRMSHFQHYRVCWDSTFVSTNHVEIMLVLPVETFIFWIMSLFLLKGLEAPLLVEKRNHQAVDVVKPFSNSHLEKHEKRFVIKLNTMLSSWEADRFYPSSLACTYWHIVYSFLIRTRCNDTAVYCRCIY